MLVKLAKTKRRHITPCDYLSGTMRIYKSNSWIKADKLDVLTEYCIICITHEQIHCLIAKFLKTTWAYDKLWHKDIDVWALVGF